MHESAKVTENKEEMKTCKKTALHKKERYIADVG